MARSTSPSGRRVLACGLLVLAALALSACDTTTGAIEDTKSFLDRAGRTIGNALGQAPATTYEKLAPEDKELASAAKLKALEANRDGDAAAWRNAKTGNSGSVTPVRTFVTDAGVFCREYREVVSIGVEKGEATSTGCRTGAKTWTEASLASGPGTIAAIRVLVAPPALWQSRGRES